MSLDPLRDPALDRVGHGAAHPAAMHWFGYVADVVRFDFRWGDFGLHGLLMECVTDDSKCEAFDRSAIHPLVGHAELARSKPGGCAQPTVPR
jgi:hypothetical protein